MLNHQKKDMAIKKFIREYTPFIILSYSFLFAFASYFEFYFVWYKYLPDLLGYSVYTNLFMLAVYWNKKYCVSTKICVIGLVLLNLFNIAYTYFNLSYALYDIYIILVIFIILILKRM